jgi:hypothetical protein
LPVVVGLFGLLAGAAVAHAARIDANPAKQYTLTPEHGPWMVMVASFQSTSEDGETKVGKKPEEAAHELVLELRRKGIPAYVHAVNHAAGEVLTKDRFGRQVRRRNLHQSGSVGVLAGNYQSIDDTDNDGEVAQRTLNWIKAYNPECLKDGVVFQKTKARPTPLAGAFLTMNPLMHPDEVAAQRSVDHFVLKLNHGERNSLLENPGKFTLVVATYAGKSGIETPLGFGGNGDKFTTDDDLDIAAQEARDLAATMRQVENVEAFVWHDRYHSVVTVGSFSSSTDPAIAAMKARFGARRQINSVMAKLNNNSVQVLAIDAQGRKIPFDPNLGEGGGLATGSTSLPAGFRIWAYDPNPQVMPVPKRR